MSLTSSIFTSITSTQLFNEGHSSGQREGEQEKDRGRQREKERKGGRMEEGKERRERE